MLKMVQSSDFGDDAGVTPTPVDAALEQDEGSSLPWYERGACLGMNPNLFFPKRGEKIPEEVAEACSSCIVRKECETAGLGEYGIWGGLSERARRQVRRRAAKEQSIDDAPTHEDDLSNPSPAGEGATRADTSSAA